METTTKQQLQEYAEKEKKSQELKAIYEDKLIRFNTANIELLTEINNLKIETDGIKETVKQEAIKEFQATGNKKLYGGIGIRVGTELLYDHNEALDWAKHHELCLKLDEKAFESLAKTQDIEFVAKQEKITATWPTKLELEQ